MKSINWNQASALGLIERVNSEVLHPLGLAMTRTPATGFSHAILVAPDRKFDYCPSVERKPIITTNELHDRINALPEPVIKHMGYDVSKLIGYLRDEPDKSWTHVDLEDGMFYRSGEFGFTYFDKDTDCWDINSDHRLSSSAIPKEFIPIILSSNTANLIKDDLIKQNEQLKLRLAAVTATNVDLTKKINDGMAALDGENFEDIAYNVSCALNGSDC